MRNLLENMRGTSYVSSAMTRALFLLLTACASTPAPASATKPVEPKPAEPKPYAGSCPPGPLRLPTTPTPAYDAAGRANAMPGQTHRLAETDFAVTVGPALTTSSDDESTVEVIELGGRRVSFLYILTWSAGCMPDGHPIHRGRDHRYLGTLVGESIACRPEASFGVCDLDVANGGTHERWRFDGVVYHRVDP